MTSRIMWTSASVHLLSGRAGNPIEVMETNARAMALKAMDKGWTGPPFDPIRLAEALGMEVEACADVTEARIRFLDTGRYRLEFNPSRSQARIFFSVAHEIAHTLFPDCRQRVRHRGAHESVAPDDWQIEVLCNVGAAELLMPIGSFGSLRDLDVTIEQIVDLRKKYQVSSEALLLRFVKVSDKPCAAFSASRVQSGRNAEKYRIEYVIGSKSWSAAIRAGSFFDDTSPVSLCVAIGFTARGTQSDANGKTFHLEAVGLPPYPGQTTPRVAGLLWDSIKNVAMPSITYVRGDALNPRGVGRRIIAQVINDKTPNWGGAGFASAVKRKWPDAHRAFVHSVLQTNREALRLGEHSALQISADLSLFSIIAQHGYGPSNSPRIRYAALEKGLEELAKFATRKRAPVHMPRIGTGNAGGSWEIISEIVDNTLVREGIPVTVYDPPT